ncbi:nucleoside diphosphate kinase regulator [Pseudidiomarina marina]|uniref:Transcription elongation factor GreAB n=1 Tax=Pseudidiomarina marina TaxID=502366 RepID=A0A432YL93_9GAMM|nr:nucleoside diphosphate kinase regulator [Pseudidiomarina marina]RUO61733.1 transcription elongation factor GreAB [Pseudidiomarina marina]
MNQQPEIMITKKDLGQIESLLATTKPLPDCADELEGELARANVVANDALPANVVALGSKVTFKIIATGATFTKVLCLPSDVSQIDEGISVFAPIGAAILGLSEGQQIDWDSPRGQQRIEIIKVAHN